MREFLSNLVPMLIVAFGVFAIGLYTGRCIEINNNLDYVEPCHYKLELLDSYDEYYSNTEALLDSISKWNESFIETDVYYNYITSKEIIDSLYKEEL